MKASDLTGAKLDFWVAKAEDFDPNPVYGIVKPAFGWAGESIRGGSATNISHRFSADWSKGGPIIEREGIHVAPMAGKSSNWCAIALGKVQERGSAVRGKWAEGPTPLIAAMRAYVISKFGDSVPD